MRKLPSKVLTDKRINALSEGAESLLYRMIVAADDFGRLVDSLEAIMFSCYPSRTITKRTLTKRIIELQDSHFLTKIVSEGRPLLEIDDFKSFDIPRVDRKKRNVLVYTNGIPVGSTKETPNPEVKEFMKYWGTIWPIKVGNNNPYPFSYGKEGKIIKEMLRTITLANLKDYAIKFLESNDPFIKNTGWTLGSFKMSITKFLSHKEDDKWKEKFLQMDSKSSPSTLEPRIVGISGLGR